MVQKGPKIDHFAMGQDRDPESMSRFEVTNVAKHVDLSTSRDHEIQRSGGLDIRSMDLTMVDVIIQDPW